MNSTGHFPTTVETLTNSRGNCCANCYKLKVNLYKKVKRREEGGIIPKPKCNHRYMTRQHLIARIQEKIAGKEKRMWLKTEKELLELEKEDHSDIVNIFNNVNKKDIPEDMAVLWQQAGWHRKDRENSSI